MRAAKSPAAQQRPPRTPLQELRLQPGTERTNLTPLLRRLRLKDRDCTTPVSCARRPPNSTSRPPRNALLLPPSSIIPEPPGTPTLGPSTLETLGSPTRVPGATESPRSTSLEPPGSSTPGLCTQEPPSSTVPAPGCIPLLGPCTPEPPSSIVPAHLCSSISEPPSSTVPAHLCSPISEPPSSTVPAHLCSPVLRPCTPEPPSSTMPASPCSPVPGLCTLEPPSSITPGPPGIISSVPYTPNSLGSTTLAPGTPGPPGTSSTPQAAPFQGWRVVPADLSCSPVAPELPAGEGTVGLSLCQDTTKGAESPDPVPPEQGPAPTEAGRSEHTGSEATATPSPEVAASAVSWTLPLVWLEKSLNASSLLDSLRHSLPLSVPRRDTGTSVTPVPTAVAGTSVTPVPTAVAGTSVTPVPTAVAGTSVTPVPTAVAGTSVTPVPTAVAGTSITPVPTMVTGTFMTPRDLQERSMNTSTGGPRCAKDSAAETDSLLWHCPREQLKSLPRAELEGRLESTLIIIEALSLQLRSLQESHWPLPSVGPAEQRDALTQTDVTHPKGEEEIYHNLYLELRRKMEALQRQRGAEQDLQRELELAATGTSAWRNQFLLFRGIADAAFQSLQDEQGALAQEREQARALVSRCWAVLQSVPGKLRSCLEERDAMRQRADEALRAKEEGDRFLEAFRAHASAQISARDQSLASQRELGTLLADAIDQQPFREFIDITFANLEEERRALDMEREQARALVSRCRAVLQSVPGKLRGCLEERDAMRQREDEALQAKEQVGGCLVQCDLNSLRMNLANLEQTRDALQQENKKQQEEMAWLVQERDTLQQECNGLRHDLREMTESREFLDQENRMSCTQLLDAEAKLKLTTAALQEHSLQYEELMESHQRLRNEHAALGQELENTKTELLDLQLKRNKVSWCSKDIAESQMRLQELADCLRAALQEEHAELSTVHLPSPLADGDEATRGGSALTKDKSASTPKPIEPEEGLLESVKELRAVVSNLTMLSCRIQELEQSEFKALQTEISDLQLQLETVTAESQEKIDAQAATIAKLNKALRGKLENEKELQDVLKQQEEKMLQLIDKSGEVTRLKGEISQLKRSLQRAETEAKVLWEEMRGQEHKVDAVYVQERVLLRQEVDKLRLLLVEKEDENLLLSNKYLEQIQGLELRLHHTHKVLRTHEEMQEKMKEVLLAVPDVATGCQEFHSLLRYLGLKPGTVSKEAAEPL
ncbi:Spag5 [Columba guinea]|nr:Spag5 [Columba guinea]